MGNGAKVALVGVLALIVAVVAAWDRTNERSHEDAVRPLPAAPLERAAENHVKLTPREAVPGDHVSGQITPGPLSTQGSLSREGKTPRVASSALAGPTTGSTVVASVPAPVAPPVPAAPAKKTHVITKSDTLSKLADAEYGNRKLWKKIWDANRTVVRDPDRLPVGKEIVIPPADGQVAAGHEPRGTTLKPSLSQTTEVSTLPAGDAKTYTVQRGDTLGKIAAKMLGSKGKWHLILEANKLPETASIREGQTLIIPSAK